MFVFCVALLNLYPVFASEYDTPYATEYDAKLSPSEFEVTCGDAVRKNHLIDRIHERRKDFDGFVSYEPNLEQYANFLPSPQMKFICLPLSERCILGYQYSKSKNRELDFSHWYAGALKREIKHRELVESLDTVGCKCHAGDIIVCVFGKK